MSAWLSLFPFEPLLRCQLTRETLPGPVNALFCPLTLLYFIFMYLLLSAQVNLQPLFGTVALSCPRIDLALIVQPPQVGVPAKGTQVQRLVATGGCYLAVRNRVILQAQRLRTSCGQRGSYQCV